MTNIQGLEPAEQPSPTQPPAPWRKPLAIALTVAAVLMPLPSLVLSQLDWAIRTFLPPSQRPSYFRLADELTEKTSPILGILLCLSPLMFLTGTLMLAWLRSRLAYLAFAIAVLGYAILLGLAFLSPLVYSQVRP